MKSASLRVSISLACALSLSGCAGFMHGGPMAKADLAATRGNSTTGFVMFHQTPNGMMVHARVSGLKPGQEHGFHIHEKGDCSSG
ncbi:MAG: superoxide dismutase family protein, partial [Desulfobacterales bacterium]|nr:superoxide dismutase family protein [Desulfobacterales bacterium]